MPQRKETFVTAKSPVPCSACVGVLHLGALTFSYGARAARPPPFAWIRASQHKHVLPLARMANRTLLLSSDDGGGLLQSLLSDNLEERSRAPPRRGHSDEWYEQRCVFCCDCKSTVNSQYQKRGSRCHGCRRWFHNTCTPSSSSSSSSSSSNGSNAAEPAGSGSNSSSSTGRSAAEGLAEAASTPQPAADQHHSTQPRQREHGLFFHSEDCRRVYAKLALAAASGEQPLPVPIRRSVLPWQWQQQQQHTWRLLDLSEVRDLYKDAQRRGTLFKHHAKIQQQLAEQQHQQAGAAAQRSSTTAAVAAASADTEQQQQQVVPKRVVCSRLDDFLVVCELLRDMGDSPKDLLEDSFAVITRTDSGAATCVATLNVYGSDHARLQGVTTPKHLQRQGHATRLMHQLETVLMDAGLQQMAVIVDPGAQDASASRSGVPDAGSLERWLGRLGYRHAGAEQVMLWRRELPEYHKSLTAGCSLLVKPLLSSKKNKGWLW